MVYPVTFYRLAMIGEIYTETWATTLSLFGSATAPVDQELLDAVTATCVAWIGGTGGLTSSFATVTRLTEVKINRIGPDGKYADPVSWTNFGSPLAVGSSVDPTPPQISPVVTLRTAFERGRAARGRMYLPPYASWSDPGSDGRVSTGVALALANSAAAFFNRLHADFLAWDAGGGGSAHPVVMSSVGAGAWHSVREVQVGRVVDTVRSRRSSLDEDYQTATTPPSWPAD